MPALRRVMREFKELVRSFEAGLLRSLEEAGNDDISSSHKEHVHREACRLAISDLSNRYSRKHIHHSLHDAEWEGKRLEEQLHRLSLNGVAENSERLGNLHNGYFRLYSTELFDLLEQPTDLRLGSLRFHQHHTSSSTESLAQQDPQSPGVSLELALGDSFFVADSSETLPYHTFRLPSVPSLQNRGILSRRPEDNGAFPDFDSWLLFTFLGNGCIKLEVPIEMCADIYGGRLSGRENEEVLFWGRFVDDDMDT